MNEFVRKSGNGYAVFSHSGKRLSKPGMSKAAANKRLGQIEYFKHAKESLEEGSVSLADLPMLKKSYAQAMKTGAESFNYKGDEILCSYAKYLIQYLEQAAGGRREDGGFRMGAQALEAEPSIAVPRRCKRCGERFMGTPKETMCADCADDDLRTGDWHKPGSKVEADWPFEVDHAGDPEPQGGEDVTCRDCGYSAPEAEFQGKHCPECGSRNSVPTEEL